MGMQCHFEIEDIPSGYRIHHHADKDEDNSLSIDYYIVIDPPGFFFSTDSQYKTAWFDVGYLSETGVGMLHWLIRNRVCFNCS